jgi:hypothetical protein
VRTLHTSPTACTPLHPHRCASRPSSFTTHASSWTQDVAKFKEVLQLNGIPVSRGLFITSSTFSPRARHIGVACLDGEEFAALESRGLWRLWARRGLALGLLGLLGALVTGEVAPPDVLQEFLRHRARP